MKHTTRILSLLFLGLSALLFLSPLLFVLTGSLMDKGEFTRTYGAHALRFPAVVPRLATLSQYGTLLLNTPGYLAAYWNSLFIALCVCLLQLLFALPCAYGFAKLDFRWRKSVLFIYVVMMMMPFQVTMLPMYQLIKWFGLFDTRWALIIPEIFTPFTVFFVTQFMYQLPGELIEAIRLESDSPIIIYRHLAIPLCKPGIIAAMILSFVETWNMVEKPLLYLSDARAYPLSMLLYEAGNRASATTLAGCILYIIPVLLLWGCFKHDICKGISQMQIK